MTRTKVGVKRRQQRRRLERDAERAQLREEQQQDEEAGAVPRDDNYNKQETGEREPIRENARGEAAAAREGLVQEPIRENAREEEQRQEIAPAEQQVNAQEDNAWHEEGIQRGGEEEVEEDGTDEGDEGQHLLTDYEKQRERRLKENAAKLAALNLPALASSIGPSTRPQRQSSKKKSRQDDDYLPSSSSSESVDSESDDNSEEGARPRNQQDVNGDYNEDQALQEAIALSLTATAENGSGSRKKVPQTQKGKRQVSNRTDVARKRRKGQQKQVTSDEIAAIFALIDERGNGKFSVAELERIARSHDFTWSKQEISDMIDFFDMDKDGQLDLSEFQGIFMRMNMLKMRGA